MLKEEFKFMKIIFYVIIMILTCNNGYAMQINDNSLNNKNKQFNWQKQLYYGASFIIQKKFASDVYRMGYKKIAIIQFLSGMFFTYVLCPEE